MTTIKLNPYLTFNGTGGDAIALYERVLGATAENVSRFRDVPAMKIAEEHGGRIMHALLRIGEGVVMVSDTMPEHPIKLAGNVHVCLHFTDEAEMRSKFDALAEGGNVTMALHDTFWGAIFGVLVDAHGIQWMFNHSKNEPAEKN